MKRYVLAVFALFALVLGSCSLTSTGAPTKSQLTDADMASIHAAREMYQQCVVDKIMHLDDGLSNALDVGRIVAAACRQQREVEYAIVKDAGVGKHYLHGYRAAGEEAAAADCAEAVLYWREHQRNESVERSKAIR